MIVDVVEADLWFAVMVGRSESIAVMQVAPTPTYEIIFEYEHAFFIGVHDHVGRDGKARDQHDGQEVGAK